MRTWQPRTLTGVAFLLAAVLFFARLGDLPLIDPDEGRNAEVAREMAESGAWVVPTFNAIPYLDKPALYFRAVALSFGAFGRSETTARLPSALSATALVVMMFVFCRRVYGERTAALTVLVLATTPLVIGFARLVIFDMPLTLFVSAAILAGYLAEEDPGPARRRWLLLGAAASAVATLIKGPVGFLVPGAVLAVLHLVERRPRAILRMLAPVNLLRLPRPRPAVVRRPRLRAPRLPPLRPGRGDHAPLPHHDPPPERARVLLRADPAARLLPVERAPARGRGGGLAEPRPVDADRPLPRRVGGGRGGLLLELAVQAPGLHPPGHRRARGPDRAPVRPRARQPGEPGRPAHPPRRARGRDPQRASRPARCRSTWAGRIGSRRCSASRATSSAGCNPTSGILVASLLGVAVAAFAVRFPARCPAGPRSVRASRGPLPVGRVRHGRPVRGGELGARAGASDLAAAGRRHGRLSRVLRRRSPLLRGPAGGLHHAARPRRADQQLRPLPAQARRELAAGAGPAGRSGPVAGKPDRARVRADEGPRPVPARRDRQVPRLSP